MQGDKTSKIMIPCGRRVNLHKSANFKTISEQNLTNHNDDVKTDSEMIGKINLETIKSDAGKHRKI